MSILRVTATVVFSLGVALALGSRFQPEPVSPRSGAAVDAAGESAVGSLGAAAPGSLSDAAPRAARLDLPVFATLTETIPPVDDLPSDAPETVATQTVASDAASCTPALTLAVQPAAMLAMRLVAPCDAGEPVAIAHGPLLLSGQIGADGRLEMALPALLPAAEVTVAFVDGRLATARADVPDFAHFQRLVVSWTGPPVLDLHAYAGGAGWGEPGHVRAGQPVSAASGFVLAYGETAEDAPQARVYTFPAGIPANSGQIRVEAEVAVTAQSCGQELHALVHAIRADAPVARRVLDVAMPGCEQPEGFVLIPDLLLEPAPDLAALRPAAERSVP